MQCYQCGEDVPREAVFCHRCGARLDGKSDPAGEFVGPDPRQDATGGPEDEQPSPAERFRNTVAGRGRDAREQEQTLWDGGYASKAMLGRWLFSGLATVASLVVGFLWPYGYVWLGIGALVLLLWGYQVSVLLTRRMSVHYRLTNQRFIHETGILRRVTNRIDLIDIDDITFEQGVIDRMVGVGIIRVSSSDRTHPELVLAGIDDVVRVAGLIDETFRAERRRRGLFVEHV